MPIPRKATREHRYHVLELGRWSDDGGPVTGRAVSIPLRGPRGRGKINPQLPLERIAALRDPDKRARQLGKLADHWTAFNQQMDDAEYEFQQREGWNRAAERLEAKRQTP